MAMFHSLNEALAAGSDAIGIRCGDDNHHMCADARSIAMVEIGGDGAIILCDLFFRDWPTATPGQHTALNLGSRPATAPRSDRGAVWCQEGEGFPYFDVAATTILQQLSALDQVGINAGFLPTYNVWGDP